MLTQSWQRRLKEKHYLPRTHTRSQKVFKSTLEKCAKRLGCSNYNNKLKIDRLWNTAATEVDALPLLSYSQATASLELLNSLHSIWAQFTESLSTINWEYHATCHEPMQLARGPTGSRGLYSNITKPVNNEWYEWCKKVTHKLSGRPVCFPLNSIEISSIVLCDGEFSAKMKFKNVRRSKTVIIYC